MDLSKRRKFGLVCLILAFIIIGYSYSLFVEAEESAKEDDVEIEVDCVGGIECFFTPWGWRIWGGPTGDFGAKACCIGICLTLFSAWILFSIPWLIFGKKSVDDVEVNFIAPPSEPPEIEDEFADLEAELDVLE
jgi:hypothetical protein